MKHNITVSKHKLLFVLLLLLVLLPELLPAQQAKPPISLADTQAIHDQMKYLPDLLYTDIDSFYFILNHADAQVQELKKTFDHSFVELECKVLTLFVEGYSLESKFDSAINKVNRFLATPAISEAKEGTCKFYCMLGNLYMGKREFMEAKRAYFQGLTLNPNPKEEAILLFNLGTIDYYFERYSSAISNYKEVIIREKEVGFTPSQMATVRLNWGAVYLDLDSLVLAERQILQSLQLVKSVADSQSFKKTYYNLARVYFQKGERQKSHAYLDSAMIYSKKDQHHILLTQIHLLKAKNFILEERPESEIREELDQAEQIIETYGLDGYRVGLWGEKASFAKAMGQYLLSKKYLLSALDEANKQKDPSLQAKFYKELALIESLLGNMDSAYTHHIRFHDLSDSLKTIEQNEAIDNIKLEMELLNAKKEKESVSKNLVTAQKLADNRYYLFLVSVSILILVTIAMLIILFQRNRIHRISKKLDTQNLRLKNLFQERQLILKLITHDLRSPLMNIQVLVANIQTILNEKNITDKELGKNLQEISLSVSDVNGLATQILESDHIIDQVEKDRPREIDLNQQLQFAVDTYRAKALKKQVEIKSSPLSAPAISISHQQGLQLIIENLLSNAIKYTPPQSEVEIQLLQLNGSYQFKIRDYGPGFTKADFAKMFQRFQPLSAKPTGGETSYGMGLYLAKKLSRQLGIDLQIGNHPEGGALAQLRIPRASKV